MRGTSGRVLLSSQGHLMKGSPIYDDVMGGVSLVLVKFGLQKSMLYMVGQHCTGEVTVENIHNNTQTKTSVSQFPFLTETPTVVQDRSWEFVVGNTI